MAGRLEGKVALITGAARGQGRAHAVALAREGADIIAIDVAAPIRNVPYSPATPEDLAITVKEVESAGRRIIAVTADIRELRPLRTAVDAAVGDLGRLDVVVANAGICIPNAWHDVTEEIFRDTMDINVTGTWNTVMVTAPHLITAGGGSIILTSSAAGLKTVPFMVNYTASKFAVTGMGKAFAAELAQHNIRVNTIHPGGVDTAMGTGRPIEIIGQAMQGNPQLGGMLSPLLPQGVAQPEDIAKTVVYLASSDSAFVTAHALAIDAGNSQY